LYNLPNQLIKIMKKYPVVHFEMPADDSKRMSEFYTKAFGWETNQLGPEMGNYVVVMTADSDKNGPLKPGSINGGFYKRSEGKQSPSFVIAVDDIREHMKIVEEAGGKIIGGSMGAGEPDDIPGVGLFVSFIDTEGNKAAMLQPTTPMSTNPEASSQE
jgi:uncharacterized protein